MMLATLVLPVKIPFALMTVVDLNMVIVIRKTISVFVNLTTKVSTTAEICLSRT